MKQSFPGVVWRLRIINIVCSFSLHAFPWLALILFLPLGQKETENFTAHAESSMFTSFDLSSYCGKKKNWMYLALIFFNVVLS